MQCALEFSSIEHGSLIDAEGIEMMKAHGTYLVADIYNDDPVLGKRRVLGCPKRMSRRKRWSGGCSARILPRRLPRV